MLWFGLRKRLARVARLLRELEARVVEVERLKGTLVASVASVENATDKLNRVVERRRKQLALFDHEDEADEEADELELPDDFPEDEFAEAVAERQRQRQLFTPGAEATTDA